MSAASCLFFFCAEHAADLAADLRPVFDVRRLEPQAKTCKILDTTHGDNYNIIMEQLSFAWDENKNTINKQKHHVSFEEAQTVFYDDDALLIDDPQHSEREERFIILGNSYAANLLVVCHCYRESETVIRIISARKATKNETRQYYDRRGE